MHPYLTLSVLTFLLSSLTTYLLIPRLRKLGFKKGWIVRPRERKVTIPPAIRPASHPYDIPLTGGIALLAAFVISVLTYLVFFGGLPAGDPFALQYAGLVLAATVIGLMGLVDDIHRIGYKPRLLIGGLTVLILLLFTIYGETLLLPGGFIVHIGVPEMLVLLIWTLGLTNAINLIDGLDGSAAGIVAIASIWLGLMIPQDAMFATVVLSAIIASCIAFLAYNFHPAKIFLGSTGTLFLGFTLATLSVWPSNGQTPIYLLPYAFLIFAVPVGDMALVVLIRSWHGKNPLSTDSWHIHDRVLLTGVSRKQASHIIWFLSCCCGAVAYISFRGLIPYLAAAGIVFILLTTFYFVVARLQKSPPT